MRSLRPTSQIPNVGRFGFEHESILKHYQAVELLCLLDKPKGVTVTVQKEQPKQLSGEVISAEFDGSHTLTGADLEAIRRTIFQEAPIAFMDTQKIILENKELKAQEAKLKGWLRLLIDKVKEDAGLSTTKVDLDL